MWTTLRQQSDQNVHELKNVFHTLRTKLGIKDSEQCLVLKYHGFLHKYIQGEMDFLYISLLDATLPRMKKKINKSTILNS